MAVHPIKIPGDLLVDNQELWLALVKPPLDPATFLKPTVANDAARAGAVEIARRVLAVDGTGDSLLSINTGRQPGLLVFPEYSFETSARAELDQLVRGQPNVVLAFAGFGAAPGTAIRDMLAQGHVLPGWNDGDVTINPAMKYNGAWCWVHRPGHATVCYLILKHTPEQTTEAAAIPNFGSGGGQLWLEADDISIAPILCSDFVLDQAHGSFARLKSKIESLDDGNRRVLVVALAAQAATHPLWPTRIDTLTGLVSADVAVSVCNHWGVPPLAEEERDQLRCITGVFVKTANGNRGLETSHPYMRPSSTQASVGSVLRCNLPGVAIGRVQWRSMGDVNRYNWRPTYRGVWTAPTMDLDSVDAAKVEMRRWPARVEIPEAYSAHARKAIGGALRSLETEIAGLPDGSKLWPRLISVGGKPPDSCKTVDRAGEAKNKRALDHAFIALSAIKVGCVVALDGTVSRPWHFFKDVHDDVPARGYVVWVSPGLSAKAQLHQLGQDALNLRYPEPTMVVLHSFHGHAPAPAAVPASAQPVKPDRASDYSADLKTGNKDYTQSRVGALYSLPLAKLVDLLTDTEVSEPDLPARLKAELNAVPA